MHRITLFIAAVALAGPTLLAAQAHDTIARGSHVRLSVPALSGDLITGTVIAVDDRRILLRPDDAPAFGGDSLSVQSSDIQAIQVNRGPRARGPSTLGYGVVGSLAGAAAAIKRAMRCMRCFRLELHRRYLTTVKGSSSRCATASRSLVAGAPSTVRSPSSS